MHLRMRVALLAEGVGRNRPSVCVDLTLYESPSSRRAGVEIGDAIYLTQTPLVALLAEGVGRNLGAFDLTFNRIQVALLAEGVGRNPSLTASVILFVGRPPRGGRG